MIAIYYLVLCYMIYTYIFCRSFQSTLTESTLLCMNIYIAYFYGITYCFFEVFPVDLHCKYGFSTGAMGAPCISGYIGIALPFTLFCTYNVKIIIPQLKHAQQMPEYSMKLAFWDLCYFLNPYSCLIGRHSAQFLGLFYGLLPGFSFTLLLMLFQGFMLCTREFSRRFSASEYASNGLFSGSLVAHSPLSVTNL